MGSLIEMGLREAKTQAPLRALDELVGLLNGVDEFGPDDYYNIPKFADGMRAIIKIASISEDQKISHTHYVAHKTWVILEKEKSQLLIARYEGLLASENVPPNRIFQIDFSEGSEYFANTTITVTDLKGENEDLSRSFKLHYTGYGEGGELTNAKTILTDNTPDSDTRQKFIDLWNAIKTV